MKHEGASERGQVLPIVIVGLAAATATGLLGHEHYENERRAVEVARKHEAAAQLEQVQRQHEEELGSLKARAGESDAELRGLKVHVESLVQENTRLVRENEQQQLDLADVHKGSAGALRLAARARVHTCRDGVDGRVLEAGLARAGG